MSGISLAWIYPIDVRFGSIADIVRGIHTNEKLRHLGRGFVV